MDTSRVRGDIEFETILQLQLKYQYFHLYSIVAHGAVLQLERAGAEAGAGLKLEIIAEVYPF